MMSVMQLQLMREIEDYVLNSLITLTSANDNLVEKFRATLLARQISHPQYFEVYQSQLAREGMSPRPPSDSCESLE